MAGSYDPVATFMSYVEPWISGTYVNIEAYDWEPKAGGQPGEGDLSKRKGSRACRDLAEAVQYIRWQDGQNREVYLRMAAHRQPGIARHGKRGVYFTALGGKANAVSLKSLYIDVDVKATGPHHRTPQAAQEAVGAMCSALGLPLPTIVVRSGGGGFHAHWVLTRPMPADEWAVLAHRLQAACKAHGVLADDNLTVNPVCLLRIPGTHNRKYGAARPVTMEILGGAVDPDDLMRLLDHYADTPPAPPNFLGGTPPVKTDYVVEFPPGFPVGPPVVLEERFSAGISGTTPYKLEEVATGCPLVRETLKTGGLGQPEPLWYALAQVAVFTEKEREDFHRLSKGDPRYDPAAADKKFDQARDEKLKQDLGWPRCKTLSEKQGNPHCKGCPNLQQQKSPFNFAVREQPEPEPPKVTPQGNGESGDSYVPKALKVTDVDGYLADLKTATYTWEKTDKKGNIIEITLWDYPMWNLDYKRDHHSQYAIHFDTMTGTNEYVHVVMGTDTLANGDTLRRCLVGRFGLGINTDNTGGILNFMASFVSQMRKTLARVNRQELMGWVEENGQPTGFIYGPHKYTPQGTENFFQPDGTIKGQYFPTGTIEPWLEAMKMINAEQRPEMDLLVATAFAAPLMKFTGEKGVVISAYSSGTAVHKTSAIKVGQSVWGSFLGINQLTDTLNSVMAKVGLTRITPTYYDEMKSSLDIKYFAKMLYTFTGGRGKGRLNRNAEIKDVDTWDTLLVGVSNDSLFDHIAQMDAATDAGVARIFEFEVKPPTPGVGQMTMGEAGEILKKLESNYGHAGARYAEYLGTNVAGLQARVTTMVNDTQKMLGAEQPERFWVSAAAVLLMGAQIANDIGLAKFDMARMRAFIDSTFTKMRAARSASGLDISKKENIKSGLADYLNTHRQNILATDTLGQSGRGVGMLVPVTVLNLGDIQHVREFTVRYARDTQTMRISRTALNAWLKEKQAAPGVFMRYLKDHYGATIVQARVTSGTSYAGAPERLIELDLAKSGLIDLYEVS